MDDHLVAALTLRTGLQATGIPSIPAAGLTTGSFTFTTTHRVINRVHRYTADPRADTPPDITAGLTHALQRMVAVGYNPYSSITVDQHFPQFAEASVNGIFFFLIRQLSGSTGTTYQLATLTRLHFNVVHIRTQRHELQLKRIAQLRNYIVTGLNSAANLQTLGSQDIPFLTIYIVHQGNKKAVRYGSYSMLAPCLDFFLVALEIDDLHIFYDHHPCNALPFCPANYDPQSISPFPAKTFSGVSVVISA